MTDHLYPNCDTQIWLRTASKEIQKPVEGKVSYGRIPRWLDGRLIRNGPGGPEAFGEGQCKHLFDGPGLLHKFEIGGGRAFYTNRFIRTKAYTRNTKARRLVLSEFGTFATPDPCHRIFERVSALFTCRMDRIMTDTANISIQPFGDEAYALAETPFAHRIDLETLKTSSSINVHKDFGLISHSSHPHVEAGGGRVFNLGQRLHPWYGPHYVIAELGTGPGPAKSPWSSARVVGRVQSRWPLSLCYMHTFSLTPNYFVLIEQPLALSLLALPYNFLWGEKPIASCLQFYPDQDTLFHVVARADGRVRKTFRTPAFFYMHTINAFEEGDGLVVDICTYKDPQMIECMYIEALKNAQSNPDYATMFRARPTRFRLDMTEPEAVGPSGSNNLVLPTAEPELIVDIGCETPQIHYDAHDGKPYRYFYAISSDVDAENPGTAEDDGIILSAVLYGGESKGGPNRISLIILDARKWEPLAKIDFQTETVIPKCLHGWFFPTKKNSESAGKASQKLE